MFYRNNFIFAFWYELKSNDFIKTKWASRLHETQHEPSLWILQLSAYILFLFKNKADVHVCNQNQMQPTEYQDKLDKLFIIPLNVPGKLFIRLYSALNKWTMFPLYSKHPFAKL